MAIELARRSLNNTLCDFPLRDHDADSLTRIVFKQGRFKSRKHRLPRDR